MWWLLSARFIVLAALVAAVVLIVWVAATGRD
jgi:hypothetical protein